MLNTDWQSLVTAGLDLVQAQDRSRWALGDLAATVETHYGQGSVKKLATEIRMPRHKTLYEYHRVSNFYPPAARVEFVQCSWSHYRAAMRLESLDAARALLTEANDNDWPVARLAREIKKQTGEQPAPEKLLDAVCSITGMRGDVVTILLPAGESHKLRDAYLDGLAVRVQIHASDEQAPKKESLVYLWGGGAQERRIS